MIELTQLQLAYLLYAFGTAVVETYKGEELAAEMADDFYDEAWLTAKDDDFLHGIYMIRPETTQEELQRIFNGIK